jgi:hypothetical protein
MIKFMRRAIAVCFLLTASVAALTGCALLPDYVGPELTHGSHISQHFGPDSTNYGSDALGATLEWSKPNGGPYLELHDGVTLEPRWTNGNLSGHGETLGKGREEFQGRFGWRFRIHKNS